MGTAATSILRAFWALLLALAIASPVVAEIGCSAEAAIHAADGDALADHDDDPAPDGGADGHCAFSHSHCGGVAPARMSDLGWTNADAAFGLAPSADFASRRPPGPDRPPRA